MRIFLYSLVTVFGVSLHAQEGQLPTNQDSLFLRAIYNEALSEGEAYENLRTLTKDIGHRLSGSNSAAQAMEWGAEVMRGYGADDVRIMPVMVPHWTRGTTAVSEALLSEGIKRPLHISTLVIRSTIRRTGID